MHPHGKTGCARPWLSILFITVVKFSIKNLLKSLLRLASLQPKSIYTHHFHYSSLGVNYVFTFHSCCPHSPVSDTSWSSFWPRRISRGWPGGGRRWWGGRRSSWGTSLERWVTYSPAPWWAGIHVWRESFIEVVTNCAKSCCPNWSEIILERATYLSSSRYLETPWLRGWKFTPSNEA